MDTDFKCLVIILRALKCLGLCPLEIKTKLKKVHYGFSWSSKATVLSLLLAFSMAFVHFIALTHVVFQQFFIFGPGIRHTVTRVEAQIRNASHMSQYQIAAHLSVLTASQTITIGQYFLFFWASWGNRQILPRFLNDAISLADMQVQSEIQAKSHNQVLSFATLLYCLTAALVPGYLNLSVMTAHEDVMIEFIFCGFVYLYMGMVEVGHDASVAFALRHLRHNFSQMRRCVQIGHIPNGGTVDKWENTIYFIRQQACLLSTYLAPAQLASFMQTVVICTLSTFCALLNARRLESTLHEASSQVMQLIVGYLFWTIYMLGRLYYKASLAQQITNEESQLALELGLLKIREHEAALKVKRLVDTMTSKPCEINLSDLVVMRKRLFLAVAGQISTYLVVITQFYQS